jgi:hypothetical protein
MVAALLLASVTLLQVQPVLAQTPSPAIPVAPAPAPAVQDTTPATPQWNIADCEMRGTADGQKVSTGGAFTVGITSGLLLGLIGTAIAYVGQGEPKPTQAQSAANPGTGCRLAYEDAYGKAGKSRKRNSALIGGLIGTAIIVTVIYSSGN